jgi:hypothetical protein
MAFEARPLRVQLPCKEITVIPAEEYDAQVQAHRYWQVIAKELGGVGFGEGQCEECSGNPSEPLCENASEKLNLYAFIDRRVLPILRKQLEARLREIKVAEEAVAKATGGG